MTTNRKKHARKRHRTHVRMVRYGLVVAVLACVGVYKHIDPLMHVIDPFIAAVIEIFLTE